MIYNGNRYIVIFSLFFLFIFSPLCADDFSWDDVSVESLLDSTRFQQNTCPPSPSDILLLLSQFGIIDLLKENLYDKSYELNNRYILDLPLFTFPWYHSRCKEKGYQFFYNATNKMTFAKECDKISSYLAIAGNDFIEKLQTSLEEISSIYPVFKPEVALELLTLFEHFTVQDRSLGIMIDGEKKINDGRLRWFLPIYWHIRNHFVSHAVEKAISNIMDPIAGKQDPDAAWFFAEQYLIEDQLGFGDLRFEYDVPFMDSDTFKARIGLMIDLPIAFPLGYGLLGSNFTPPKCRPILDLQKLFTLLICDTGDITNAPEATDFLYQALNNLSAILLNSATGNNGHIGLGIMWRTKSALTRFVPRPWAEPIYFQSRMSVEYLLPGTEYRAFVQKNNSSAFESRNFESADPNIAGQNLLFLEQTLTDRLFPPFIHATVFPGFVIRSTSRAVYEGPVWGFFVGSDTWIKTKEHITSLETSDCFFNSLNIANAERPVAYQSKMFAGIVHRYCMSPDSEWAFSVNYDATVIRSGIGKDTTLTFNIDINF